MNLIFSKHAVDALNAASSCARQLGHDHVGCEHIFLSLLAIPQSQASKRLQTLGLAVLPADAVVPGMAEEEFVEMGKKIDE